MIVDMGPKGKNLLTFANNVELGIQATTSDVLLRMRSDLVPRAAFFQQIYRDYCLYHGKILYLNYHHLSDPFVISDYIHVAPRNILLRSAKFLGSGDGLIKLIFSVKSQKHIYPRDYILINESALTVALICSALNITPFDFNWTSKNDWNYFKEILFHGIDCGRNLRIPNRLKLYKLYNLKSFIVSRLISIFCLLRGLS